MKGLYGIRITLVCILAHELGKSDVHPVSAVVVLLVLSIINGVEENRQPKSDKDGGR